MGYGKRNNGQIDTFWPDNTPTELWLGSDYSTSIQDLIDKAKEHFGQEIKLDDLIISSEYIHTDCLYYDLYDAGDWTKFVKIEKKTT